MNSVIRLIVLLVGTCAVNAQLTFDLRDTAGLFSGFGVQIWRGDLSVEPILRDLNVAVVRIDLGKFPKKIDTDGWGDEEYDDFYQNYKWKHHLATAEMLKKYEVKTVINTFAPLETWMVDTPRKNTLRRDHYAHFTKRVAAALAGMAKKGIHPIGVEPFNEPDGDWSCYVAPEEYNDLVLLLRQELDKRDLEDILILGPGLSHIDTGPNEPWIAALTPEGAGAIGAWSAHGYHWDTDANQDPRSMRDAYKNSFESSLRTRDLQQEKPVFITEFSPLRVWSTNPLAIETQAFAARGVEDALSFLNSGANYVIFWEAADTKATRKHNFGMLRFDKTRRPSYAAFQSVFSQWEAGSRMLSAPPERGPGIYAAASLNFDETECVVSLINSTDQPQTETIVLHGSGNIAALRSIRFEDEKLKEGKPPELVDNKFVATLPPFSTQTVTFSVNL